MKLHTYIFFFSVLISGILLGQEETKKATVDTLPPAEKYGFRAGIDLSRIIRTSVNKKYKGLEIIGDYRIYRNFYIAAEVGHESLLRDEENINVKGSGNYFRIGFDYNTYKNWYGMQNNITVGLRYSYASFDQTLNNYRIYMSEKYFKNEIIEKKIEVKDLNAGWLEFIIGMKVETLKNLYLGANISIKKIIKEETPAFFDNLFIPGFGKTNDFSSYGVGYSYSLSYLIPFTKKKK